MVQGNELRIGNAIYCQGKLVKVNLHTLGHILYPELTEHQRYKGQYEPIPLTPEVLEKAGFEWTTKGFAVHPKMGAISIKRYTNSRQSDLWSVKCNYVDLLTSIIYLHQLQNLYFAFTGQELPIDLSDPKPSDPPDPTGKILDIPEPLF